MKLTETILIAFLKDTLGVEGEIDADTALFSTGALDSVSMMNLITFVEETARIEVSPWEVTMENFDTPARIVAYAASQR